MDREPRFTVRAPVPGDVPAIAALMRAYMRETYADEWHGSDEALLRDAFGAACEMRVAQSADGRLTGFVAWAPAYDLHHCVRGADVADLYVAPEERGRGVAAALLCAAAKRVAETGGIFLRGGAVESGTGQSLYGRFAVCDAGVACTVGGRAFRRLAELAGRPAREVVRSLPEKAWNYEA